MERLGVEVRKDRRQRLEAARILTVQVGNKMPGIYRKDPLKEGQTSPCAGEFSVEGRVY